MTTKKAEQVKNLERVGSALALLQQGLRPFVEREIKAQYGGSTTRSCKQTLANDRGELPPDPLSDVYLLLRLMWDQWNQVFRRTLGPAERSHVKRAAASPQPWAHQEPFSTDDAYRALDSAAPAAGRLGRGGRRGRRREAGAAAHPLRGAGTRGEAGASGAHRGTSPGRASSPGARSSRPHADVACGRYQQAEFAADLARSIGARRRRSTATRRSSSAAPTSPTACGSCSSAAERLTGTGGDPVVELQTNFGGGKTHSMLALYHLFSGAAPRSSPASRTCSRRRASRRCPKAHRAVLVGTAISPGQAHARRTTARVVRTLVGRACLAARRGKTATRWWPRPTATATNPGDALRRAVQVLLALPGPDRRVGGLRAPALHDRGTCRRAASTPTSPSPRR